MTTDDKELELGLLKLITGEVILGKFCKNSLNQETILVEKPFQLLLDATKGGIGMMPYNALYSQQEPEDWSFKVNHIMEFIPVHKSFEEAYIQQTTGIETSMPEIDLGAE